MTKKSITLFYAEWCMWCNKFKPEWNKLKQEIKDKNLDIDIYEYNDEDIEKQNIDRTINNVKTTGFPVIKIIINNKEYKYEQERTAKDILEFMNKQQTGGSDIYYKKYMKYKAKYIALQKKLNNL